MKGQHYTTAELDAMDKTVQPAPAAPAAPAEAQYSTGTPNSAGSGGIGDFGQGIKTSALRTAFGLNQLKEYLTGTPEQRAEANEMIRLMEEDQAAAGKTGLGKLGEFIGTTAQFAAIPGAATATPLRAMATGAGFGATQPVEPIGEGTGQYVTKKLGRAGLDAALAGAGSGVAKVLTREGIPIPADRAKAVAEAERLGLNLTPAQRTGDLDQAIYQKGLSSRPGSATIIGKAVQQPQTKLNEAGARALGSAESAPTESVLAEAGAKAAKGYEPIAKIHQVTRGEPELEVGIGRFIQNQSAEPGGSTAAAEFADKFSKSINNPDRPYSGSKLLEQMQKARDASFEAAKAGKANEAEAYRDLAQIIESYLGRELPRHAAVKGSGISAGDLSKFQKARTEYAKIHSVENVVNPVTGEIPASRYLKQEFKRQPAHRGRGTSPLAKGMREVGDIARVMETTKPRIGSSGTPEGMAGGQMVDVTAFNPLNPLAWIKAGGQGMQMGRNALAAKLYLRGHGPYGGSAGYLPGNAMVRRLLPGAAVGFGEAESQ